VISRRGKGVGVTLTAVAAVAAVSMVGHAGAGVGSSPAKTIPAPPTTTTPVNGSDTVIPASSIAPDSTAPANPDPPETGIDLRANAGLPEILARVRAIAGPTSDVVRELRVLANVPENILSPAGSSIREFGVDYHGIDGYFVADVTFTSDATAADAVTFYQATMSAAGFVPVSDTSLTETSLSHRLRFETPTSPYADATVEVVVTDGLEDVIELTITDAASRDVLQAFTGWAPGMPGIAEGEPIEAGLVATVEPGLTVTLSTRFGFDNYTSDDLASMIRSSLPVGGYDLDPDLDVPGSRTIAVRHALIDDVALEISDGSDYHATMSLTGTVTF
jgi:hypothetical protein